MVTLKRDRTLGGQMTVSFVVSPESGKFRKVRVMNSQIRAKTLQCCVVAKTKGLKLQWPPDLPVLVAYPIRFA